MAKKVIGDIGASIKACERMYKAVVQAVLLCSIKMWLVMDAMIPVIEGFHQSITRGIAGMTGKKGDGREWAWALLDAVLNTTGIWLIREYARIRWSKIKGICIREANI